MVTRLRYRRHDRFGTVVTPGTALRACRVALEHGQHELAARLGVSRRTLSRCEFDDQQPPVAERERVMTWLADAPPHLVRALANAWGIATPPQAMPPPVVTNEAIHVGLGGIVFKGADDLDVSPRRLRAVLIDLLKETERLQLAPRAAREQLEANATRPTPPAKT